MSTLVATVVGNINWLVSDDCLSMVVIIIEACDAEQALSQVGTRGVHLQATPGIQLGIGQSCQSWQIEVHNSRAEG